MLIGTRGGTASFAMGEIDCQYRVLGYKAALQCSHATPCMRGLDITCSGQATSDLNQNNPDLVLHFLQL